MYIGQLTMAMLKPVERETASEAINDLLCALRTSGQICGDEWSVAVTTTGYVATVLLPEKTSLEAEHHNRGVRRAWENLLEVGFAEPECQAAEDLLHERSCACVRSPIYILYTHFISDEPPLRCGRCFLPVALYRVLAKQGDTDQGILHWQAYYKACDTLQIGNGPLELSGREQMEQLDSHIAQEGLAICRSVQDTTGIPTYYYLFHPTAHNIEEDQARRCPSCQGEWLLPASWHKFDFRCDRCRLVSNIAWDIQ